MKLTVGRAAIADVERLREFLAENDSDTAQRAAAAIGRSAAFARGVSARGRPSGIAGLRELIVPFGQSAYVVRYAYVAARDENRRLAHLARPRGAGVKSRIAG